jgi:hypothetical protein
LARTESAVAAFFLSVSKDVSLQSARIRRTPLRHVSCAPSILSVVAAAAAAAAFGQRSKAGLLLLSNILAHAEQEFDHVASTHSADVVALRVCAGSFP